MSKDNSKSRKGGTQTSAFGTPGRINHDASAFYGGKLYADQEPPKPDTWTENPIPTENLDRFYCAIQCRYVRDSRCQRSSDGYVSPV